MSEEKETPKYVDITPQKYRQLDFLRLFRLCRSLELFNRKRKMPTEYNTDDSDKDDKNSRSACRRMLRALIIHVFPDGYIVKSNFNNYFVEFSIEMRNTLSYINSNLHEFRRSSVDEYREAAEGYTLLASSIGGFVYPRIPYNIKIHFADDLARRQHRGLRRMALDGNSDGSFVWKPSESFYKCAVACLEYKEHWDKYSELLIEVVEKHKEDMKNGEKQRQQDIKNNKRKVNSMITNAVITTDAITATVVNTESTRILTDAIARSAEHGPRNTQESFDRALQRLQERRGTQ